MARNRKSLLVSVAVTGLVLLAGCQTSSVAKHTSPFPVEENPAVSLNPVQLADMHIAMAQSMEKQGDIDKAKHAYKMALQKDPKRADAFTKLATLHARRGEFTEAAGLYRKALELEPNNADIYCNIGYTHHLQDQWVEAEAALRKCLKLQPDHKRAHNNLGLVLARKHQPAEALAQFRKAGCGDADARLNLAYAQTLGQDFGEARKGYEKVLASDPSSKPAQKGLDRVTTLTKSKAVAPDSALAVKDVKPVPPTPDANATAIRLAAAKEDDRLALQAKEQDAKETANRLAAAKEEVRRMALRAIEHETNATASRLKAAKEEERRMALQAIEQEANATTLSAAKEDERQKALRAMEAARESLTERK